MRATRINLADAIRALRLAADDAARTRTLRLLGFEWRKSTPAEPAIPVEDSEGDRKNERNEAGKKEPPVAQQPTTAPMSEDTPNEAWVDKMQKPTGRAPPDWYSRTNALAPDSAPAELPRPKVEPLFAPEQQRSTLLALVSRLIESREVDVARAAQRIANLETLTQLPFRKRTSVRRGVQVVLDVSPRMQPFVDDEVQLVASLLRLLPTDVVQVARCYGAPPDGPKSQSRYGEYRKPPPGTPVLLVSDVGEGGAIFAPLNAEADDWIGFAQRLSTYGCQLIILAPVSPEQISATIRQHLVVVPWDRSRTGHDLLSRLRQPRVQ
jgi:hypothetical protein